MWDLAIVCAWSAAVVLLRLWFAHIPRVADFASHYIDLVLVGIVLISVVPVKVRTLIAKRKKSPLSAAAQRKF